MVDISCITTSGPKMVLETMKKYSSFEIKIGPKNKFIELMMKINLLNAQIVYWLIKYLFR